jgi:hypothetical protein
MSDSPSSRAKPRDPAADPEPTNSGSLGYARDDGGGERIPLFGTWRTAYVVVVAVFVLDVALFYAISRLFA